MKQTRRSVLQATAAAATVGPLAGCLSGLQTTDTDGYAAFFALWDFAEQVGGDVLTFENPVETGSMGHGWSPDGDLTRDIASSQVFVYLDTPEWTWAQDVATELERDHPDVTIIDALAGLGPQLIRFDTDAMPEPDRGHEYPPENIVFQEFDIIDLRSEDQLGYWHTDHWHGGIPEVPVDGEVPIGIVLRDRDGRVVPLGETEPYRVTARVAEGEPDDVLTIHSEGAHVEFHGNSTGTTAVVFEIWHDDELVYETADGPARIEVVAEIDDDGAGAFHDPHAWVDPVLAQQMVETIADGLAAADPENADTFAENAAAYSDRLQSVREQLETISKKAQRDVAVFAGHDSYAYIERRYDLTLHTPVGIAPDDAETFDDIRTIIDIVETNDIDTVLYDPFEAPDPDTDLPEMVDVLYEHTDVTNAEPLSPASGTTEEWNERGWGYIEQMEEMNIPSLRAAFGAE